MTRSPIALTLVFLLALPALLPATEADTFGSSAVQARAVVSERIACLGLTTEEAQQRVAQLSDSEVLELAAAPDVLQVAGTHRETAMVMVTILMVVGILAVVSLAG